MKRGTTVLTPFPFFDLTGRKVRPAVVVSRTGLPGNDVVLAYVTSTQKQVLFGSDLLIEDSHPDFALTGFKTTSVIKLDKVVTLQRRIVLGQIGELSPALLSELNQKLRFALEL